MNDRELVAQSGAERAFDGVAVCASVIGHDDTGCEEVEAFGYGPGVDVVRFEDAVGSLHGRNHGVYVEALRRTQHEYSVGASNLGETRPEDVDGDAERDDRTGDPIVRRGCSRHSCFPDGNVRALRFVARAEAGSGRRPLKEEHDAGLKS